MTDLQVRLLVVVFVIRGVCGIEIDKFQTITNNSCLFSFFLKNLECYSAADAGVIILAKPLSAEQIIDVMFSQTVWDAHMPACDNVQH